MKQIITKTGKTTPEEQLDFTKKPSKELSMSDL